MSDKSTQDTMQRKGGLATYKKHGKKHYAEMAAKRWRKEKRNKRKRT